MQPRPIAMPVRQSAAPSTRDKSPPSASSSQPSVAVKAEAEASTSEPTTTAKPKRKRKKKAQAAAVDRGVLASRPSEEQDVEPAMVTDAGSAAPRPFRGKCLYQSRKCENERALKRNGLPHNLCEEHRSKQNQHQRKFDAKKFSRKRRSDTEGELEDGDGDDGDEGDEPSPQDKKRARVSTSQQQQQTQQPVIASTPLSMPPQSVSFSSGPAHALYIGAVAPMATSFHVGASPRLSHFLANPSVGPAMSHQEYHRPLLPHPTPSPQQQHVDHRVLLPHPSLSPRHLHHHQQVAYSAGYSRSELEAARILVPRPMTTPSSTSPAYMDARPAYLKPRPYQLPPEPRRESYLQPVMRRAVSVPPMEHHHPQSSMPFHPQAIAPSPHVLPSLRHPPTPTFAHVQAQQLHRLAPSPPLRLPLPPATSTPVEGQRLHRLAPSMNTSVSPTLSLRLPLPPATSTPVHRLASLAPAPVPLPSRTSDVLPSLAPTRPRQSPLRPATSQ